MSTPTIIYSVWSYPLRAYEYFEGPFDGRIHSGNPPKASGADAMGATPEQAAWKLPAGARKVGQGPIPKGKIASMGDAPGADASWDWKTVAVIAAAVYFATRRRR